MPNVFDSSTETTPSFPTLSRASAMVTPSLVMVGAPHFLSRTTLRPRGPSVIETVSASLSTPASRARRASSVNFSCLAAMGSPSPCARPRDHPEASEHRWVQRLLLDDREDVAAREDEVLLALHLDLGAPVLRVDDLVADLDVEGDPLPVLEPAGSGR